MSETAHPGARPVPQPQPWGPPGGEGGGRLMGRRQSEAGARSFGIEVPGSRLSARCWGEAGCGAGWLVRRLHEGRCKVKRFPPRLGAAIWPQGVEHKSSSHGSAKRGAASRGGEESRPSRLEKTPGVTSPTPAHPECRVPMDLNPPGMGKLFCPGWLRSAVCFLELKCCPALCRPQRSSGVSPAGTAGASLTSPAGAAFRWGLCRCLLLWDNGRRPSGLCR